jgi:hypothetical protein
MLGFPAPFPVRAVLGGKLAGRECATTGSSVTCEPTIKDEGDHPVPPQTVFLPRAPAAEATAR